MLCCNGQEEATLTEILKHLEKAYCGQLSAEIQHIVVCKRSLNIQLLVTIYHTICMIWFYYKQKHFQLAVNYVLNFVWLSLKVGWERGMRGRGIQGCGTRGRRDVGLGDMGLGDAGTWDSGTWDAGTWGHRGTTKLHSDEGESIEKQKDACSYGSL